MKDVHWKDISGYNWMLLEPYTRQVAIRCSHPVYLEHGKAMMTTNGELSFVPGFVWDGASGPTVDTDNAMMPSMVHDFFYRVLKTGLFDQCQFFYDIDGPRMTRADLREYADQLFWEMLIQGGMHPARATVWWLAVRASPWAAWRSWPWRKLNKWM